MPVPRHVGLEDGQLLLRTRVPAPPAEPCAGSLRPPAPAGPGCPETLAERPAATMGTLGAWLEVVLSKHSALMNASGTYSGPTFIA